MRQHGERTSRRHRVDVRHCGGVKRYAWPHQAACSRSDQADARFNGDFFQSRSCRDGLVAAIGLETQGQNQRVLTAASAAFANNFFASRSRRRDERKINALGQISHARNARLAENFLVLWVDRVNAALIRMRMQALPERETEAAGALGRTHHGDGLRFEQPGKFMLCHAPILRCGFGASISGDYTRCCAT